jgi:molybdopterin converting factor small subunit
MSATIHLHQTHRALAGGRAAVEVEGATVGECLEALAARFPGMRAALWDESGRLKNQIEIYLNAASAYPDELKKPVKPGDEIHLTVMLAGG